ncbi:uncharacterized protein SOCE26_061390 [Sorangium cellulosum]|uniref:Uncharacterized protein n=1 Tax=Sorangium cellulosum TaxID=56 RepID=A0A2L0EZD9_SORCE|nr:hypothetical protein [Sorangium cellulosum]AUX44672.1 uncharacterized protein SOCE26_061390 [Sorangium cellulosum]
MREPAAPGSLGHGRPAALRRWGNDEARLDAAREGSLVRARSPLGLAGPRPWHCSPRVLRMIVALALSREEIGALMGTEGGGEAGEEPSGEVLRVFIDRVMASARAARRLAGALDAALVAESQACSHPGLCVAELAARWAGARAAASSREAAALLWASARMPGSPMRFLEERVADDIEMRALRAMAVSARTAGAARWSSARRPARRAGERRNERGLDEVALARRGR